MAALNDLVTPSLTFEEILSDGSTLTNPAADTRRLFLGEDGLFHMIDSAGTVTDVGGSGTPADILDIPTAEMDDTLVLAPDGAGGVEFRAEAGGAGGTFPLGLAAADVIPASPGAYDEEWEGTADTLPTDWSWIGTPPATVKINSRYESLFVLERPGANSATYELRRASVTPGAIDFGIWWKLSMGVGQYNNNGDWCDLQLLNSGETEGRSIRMNSSGVIDFRSLIASAEASAATMPFTELVNSWLYFGLTRTSADSWRAWASGNGVAWIAIGGAASHSFTVDRFRMRFNSGNNSGAERNVVDWVRYRTDVEFPRP